MRQEAALVKFVHSISLKQYPFFVFIFEKKKKKKKRKKGNNGKWNTWPFLLIPSLYNLQFIFSIKDCYDPRSIPTQQQILLFIELVHFVHDWLKFV